MFRQYPMPALIILAAWVSACGLGPSPSSESSPRTIRSPAPARTAAALPGPPPTEQDPSPPSIEDAIGVFLSLDGRVFDAIYSHDGGSVWIAFEAGANLAFAEWELDASETASGLAPEVIRSSCPAGEADLAISADGSLLAVSVGKAVVMVDAFDRKILDGRAALSRGSSPSTARSLAFSPLGSQYVEGGGHLERMDLADSSGRSFFFQGFFNPIRGDYDRPEYEQAETSGLFYPHVIEYSPDGRLVGVGGGDFVGLWDNVAGYRFGYHLGYDFVRSIAFSPDSQTMVFVSDGGELHRWDLSRVWEIADFGEPELMIDGGVGVRAAYAPDGKSLAVGLSDGSIQFRDAQTFAVVNEVQAHASRVTRVQYSATGEQLLSSSYDGEVVIWDVATLHSTVEDRSSLEADEAGTASRRGGSWLRLTSVHMVDADTGWAIGSSGRLLRTADGGAHWGDVSPAELAFSDDGLFILDGSTAWVTPSIPPCYREDCNPAGLMEAEVWKTEDGGESWTASRPFQLGTADGGGRVPYYRPAELQFVDPLNGWLLTSVDHRMRRVFYRLFATSDGGRTWNRLVDETNGPPLVEAFDVAFFSSEEGFLVGEGPQEYYDSDHLYYSADAGVHWRRAELEGLVPWQISSVESIQIEALSPAVMSFDSRAQSMQSRSTDCDPALLERHALLLSPTGGQIRPWRESRSWEARGSYYFMNEDLGWRLVVPGAGLSNTLDRTRDGGVTWQLIRRVAWQEAQFSFVDERTGWAVVSLGEESALVRTTDGGQSWGVIRPILGEADP